MIKQLKVISWNVHIGTFAKDSSFVVEVLEKQGGPDVICLQEYVEGADSTAISWLQKHGYDMSYLPFAKFPQDQTISQGVMIATKKVLKAKVQPVVLREDEPRRFRNFPNIRGMLHAEIKVGAEVVHIFNIHATVPRPHTIDMRKREFEALKKYLESMPKNSKWFMCGDFNFLAHDRRRKWLTNRYAYFTGSLLHKTWKHHPVLSPLSLNLDYLFWKDVNVNPSLLPFSKSDHRPLHVELNF